MGIIITALMKRHATPAHNPLFETSSGSRSSSKSLGEANIDRLNVNSPDKTVSHIDSYSTGENGPIDN